MTVHLLARISGNFGISFFTPLAGGNVAESLYDVGLSFQETVIVSFVAAIIYTGLYISKEAMRYGEKRNKV